MCIIFSAVLFATSVLQIQKWRLPFNIRIQKRNGANGAEIFAH